MKRIIYTPEIGEEIPNGARSGTYATLGFIVDVIVPDDFTTAVAIHCAPETQHLFPEPFNHQFQGFEFSLGPAHEDLLP